jgi:rod shape determining protein RodA
MPYTRRNTTIARLNWTVILIWLTLSCIGIANIYAATYNETVTSVFDLSSRSGMQVLWLSVAVVIGIIILIIDSRFYFSFAVPFYILAVLLMLLTLIFGKTVNGAKSWFVIGKLSIQSVEFMKVAAALLLARIVSVREFNMRRRRDFLRALVVLVIPLGLAFLQHDMGSALVFTSFIVVFYRAGMRTYIAFSCMLMVLLFIISLLLVPDAVLIILSAMAFISYMFSVRKVKRGLLWMLVVAVLTAILFYGLPLFNVDISFYYAMLIAHALIIPVVIIYALWRKISYLIIIAGLFVFSVGVCYSVDFVFDNVLKDHQRHRIADLLGIESDLKGAGYNVHQSKIAIGSGGLSGKGFLQGTQTKFNFVPEQSTDFIFCTVGEEWGFVGSLTLIFLFLILLWSILNMAEKQKSPFARFYGYSVVSILFFHIVINLGMTVGIMPVIGIPLPFVSYGGSAMWAFTILLFILLKLDLARYE